MFRHDANHAFGNKQHAKTHDHKAAELARHSAIALFTLESMIENSSRVCLRPEYCCRGARRDMSYDLLGFLGMPFYCRPHRSSLADYDDLLVNYAFLFLWCRRENS
jgi:hypothetical protein